jgi:acyl-CoA thioester hydrolase
MIYMSRIDIQLPDKFPFSTDIPLRRSDINGGRHLAFHMVLSFTEEARSRFWKFLGYSEGNVNDVAVITADAGIIYKKQGFYGQTLKVEVGIAEFHTKGCDVIFRMSNLETGEEMFRAKTGVLFFNYQQQKVVSVPEDFRTRVAALQS